MAIAHIWSTSRPSQPPEGYVLAPAGHNRPNSRHRALGIDELHNVFPATVLLARSRFVLV